MLRYLLRQSVQYGVVIWLALSFNFAMPRLMPGDPLPLLAGDDVSRLEATQRQQILQSYGLDKSISEQYAIYLGNLLHGDLGYSFHERRPVAQILGERLPWTLVLVGSALALSSLLGVTLGALAGWRRTEWLDIGSLSVFLFLDSLPSFWLGMLFIVFCAVQWRLFPLFGALSFTQVSSGGEYILDVLKHLALPVITLMLVSVGGMFMTTRYAMLSVRGEEYILTARAKGVRERRVLFRHALRNAALPVTTALLLRLGAVTGGATVVETIFTYPGLGRLLYQAVLSRDYPMVQGAFLLFTLTVVGANLVADALYPFLDPRVRLPRDLR